MKERRSVTTWPVAFGIIAMLLLAYVLSAAPAFVLVKWMIVGNLDPHQTLVIRAYFIFYSPVFWALSYVPVFKAFMNWYMQMWFSRFLPN